MSGSASLETSRENSQVIAQATLSTMRSLGRKNPFQQLLRRRMPTRNHTRQQHLEDRSITTA
jgi:hypothetical protein